MANEVSFNQVHFSNTSVLIWQVFHFSNLNNMIAEVEVRVRNKKLTQTLKAVFAKTVGRAVDIFDSRSVSGQLAQFDEVALDAAEKSGLELVKPQGVLLQLDVLVLFLVVANFIIGQSILKSRIKILHAVCFRF